VHDRSNLTVLDSAFANNVGSDGGAITVWNSSLLVNGTAFTNNSAGGTGAPGSQTNEVSNIFHSRALAGLRPCPHRARCLLTRVHRAVAPHWNAAPAPPCHRVGMR